VVARWKSSGRSAGNSVLEAPRPLRAGPPDDPGDGGGGDDGGDGHGDGPPDDPEGVARFALGLAMVGIATLFAVLLVVSLLLRRPALDWKALRSPALEALWISSACLAASSATIEAAARSARRAHPASTIPLRWLLSSIVFGLAFVGAQILLWLGLVRSGLVPAASGYAAVFFALTGLHALHVLGGLAFLVSLALRWRRRRAGGASLRLAAVYWHFMGLLWVLLFAFLYFGR